MCGNTIGLVSAAKSKRESRFIYGREEVPGQGYEEMTSSSSERETQGKKRESKREFKDKSTEEGIRNLLHRCRW